MVDQELIDTLGLVGREVVGDDVDFLADWLVIGQPHLLAANRSTSPATKTVSQPLRCMKLTAPGGERNSEDARDEQHPHDGVCDLDRSQRCSIELIWMRIRHGVAATFFDAGDGVEGY